MVILIISSQTDVNSTSGLSAEKICPIPALSDTNVVSKHFHVKAAGHESVKYFTLELNNRDNGTLI